MNTDSRHPDLPRPWWGPWRILIAVLLATLIVLALLMQTDWDLARIQELAKRQGTALTSQELGVAASPPEIVAVVGKLKNFDALTKSISYKNPSRFGLPIPEDFWTHYTDKPDLIVQLLITIDELGVDVIRETEDPNDFDLKLQSWFRIRPIANFLIMRLRLVETSHLCDESKRICRLIGNQPPNGSWSFSMRSSLINALASSLAYRLPDVKSLGGDPVDPLIPLVDDMAAYYRDCEAGQLTFEWAFFQNPEKALRAMNITVPNFLEFPVTRKFYFRLGRAGFMKKQLEWLRFLSTEPDLPGILLEAKRTSSGKRDWTALFRPSEVVSILLTHAFIVREYAMESALETEAKVRVLHAEAHGQPWPADPFDPKSGAVRRVERSGKLIGAYSVGNDGTDEAGSRSTDLCWPLYEELGRPKAGDPPPKP
jgi:hypothetical protein